MYRLAQEVEALFILPAIRRELSKDLIRTHGVTYERTGILLGVTKAAVSQYLANKRAAKIKLHPRAILRIKKSSIKIIKNKTNVLQELQNILTYMRRRKYYCEICGGSTNGVLHDCKQLVPNYLDDQ